MPIEGEAQRNSSPVPSGAAAASDACTRSGAFALLLSALLLMLMPSWMHREKEIAFARYLNDRLNLSLTLGQLDTDPVWQRLKDGNSSLDATAVAQLLARVPLETSGSSASSDRGRGRPLTAPRTDRLRRPAAPTALRVSVMQDLPEIPTLKKLLQELNDPTLLQQSRGYSNFYDYSIVRWVNRRSGLIYRNSMDHNCASAEIELPQGPKTPKVFVPAINPDVLLACLTLSDVRELAHFEEPSMASSEQIGTRIQREVEIAPGSLPRDLLLATVFAQVLLFFVLIYFAAFAVEGALIDGFPAPGTLFSAFARSRFTLVSLVLAFLSPFAASLAVAISARVPWLGICSILIICPAFQAYAALQRKAYFRPLNPRGWMPKAAIATEPPSGQNEPKS